MLLCENQEGYRNLIKLVSTGYLDGFYYKPRIDKDLLAQHSKGLIALSACLRGDINETLLRDTLRRGQAPRLRVLRTSSARTTSSSRFRTTASTRTSSVMPAGQPAVRARPASRWSPPTTRTTCEHDDARAHEILLCIQTGKTMSATRTG